METRCCGKCVTLNTCLKVFSLGGMKEAHQIFNVFPKFCSRDTFSTFLLRGDVCGERGSG